MSTNDVPGARSSNNDVLAMGCWAEAEDGSLLFVKSVEGGRVLFEMYDLAENPITQYVDGMTEIEFKKLFSYDSKKTDITTGRGKKVPMTKWTWHDKTPFPWDRVIKSGAKSGTTFAHAGDLIAAADNVRKSQTRVVAEALGASIQEAADDTHMGSTTKSGDFMTRLKGAIDAGLDHFNSNG